MQLILWLAIAVATSEAVASSGALVWMGENNTLYCSNTPVGFPFCEVWDYSMEVGSAGIHGRRAVSRWEVYGTSQGHMNEYNYSIIPGTDSMPVPCDYTNQSCTFVVVSQRYTIHHFCEMIGICTMFSASLSFSPTPPEMLEPLPTATPTVYVDHTQNSVKASYTSMEGPACYLTRGTFSTIIAGNNTNCSIFYPKWAMTISTQVYFSIIQSGEIVYEDNWWEPGVATCDLFASVICCDRHNYTCMFLYSPWWWLGFVIVIILLLMLACPCFAAMSLTLLWLLSYPLILLFKASLWLLRKIPIRRAPRAQYRKASNFLTLFLVVSSPMMVLACSYGGQVSVPMSSCVKSSPPNADPYYTCTASIITQFTLPYLHASACFDLVIDTMPSSVIGQLNFTFEREDVYFTTKRLYYTGFWDLFTESSKRCQNAGECTTTKCETLNATTDYDAYGELTDHIVTSWPGRTYCDSSCGCWGCNCFYCVDGCLFSRFAVVPHNTTVFSVEEVVTLVKEPVVSYSLFDGISSFSGLVTFNSPTVTTSDFTFNIVGSLSENPTFFNSNKFIFNPADGSVRYGQACSLDQPILGAIGDLQASTAAYPYTENRAGFNFQFSAIQKSVGTSKTTFTSVQNGARLLKDLPSLPYTIGSYHVYSSLGSLMAHSTNPAPVIISAISTNSLVMRRTIVDNCPEILFLNGTGCYSCGTPSTVFIRARAGCQPGYIALYENAANVTLVTPSVYLTSYEEDLPIDILLTIENPSFQLCFVQSAGTGPCTDVSFTATEFVNTATDDIVDPVVIEPDKPSGYKLDFLGSFGLPRWLSCTLDIIIITVALALVIFILVVIIKAIVKARYKKNQ